MKILFNTQHLGPVKFEGFPHDSMDTVIHGLKRTVDLPSTAQYLVPPESLKSEVSSTF